MHCQVAMNEFPILTVQCQVVEEAVGVSAVNTASPLTNVQAYVKPGVPPEGKILQADVVTVPDPLRAPKAKVGSA